MTEKEHDPGLAHKHHDLLFGVRRSVRYHYRRRAFHDRLSKTAAVLSAISGSATIITLFSALPKAWPVGFAAAVAVFSAINLVLSPAQAARAHHDLIKSFLGLEKDILAVDPKVMTAEDYNRLNARRLDIEAEEPPPLKVLNCICHNELTRAMGYDSSQQVEIKWYHRWTAPFFDFCDHRIGPKSA